MLGNLISAGASLIGGFMNKESAEDTREAQINMTREQMAAQKEFAQNGLSWKINDALRNADKIHPIYSMGSAGASFSPVSTNFSTDSSMGNAVASAGQDIGRAVNATATQPQRINAYQEAAQQISLEKGTLENELLKTQLASQQARLRAPATPPFPAVGSNNYLIPEQAQSGPNAGAFKDKIEDRVPSAPGQPQQEGGAIPDVGYARTSTGYAPVPSKNVKERIEDMHLSEVLWMMRNNLMPTLGMRDPPPNSLLSANEVWRFNPVKQEYYKAYRPRSSGGRGW